MSRRNCHAFIVGLAWSFWLLASGCAPVDGGETTATEKVGPSGGVLTVRGSSVRLQVPAGALDKEVELTVRTIPDGELPSNGIPDTGVELGPEGTTFSKPVELTVTYHPESLRQPDTSWLRVAQLKPDGHLGATLFLAHDAASHSVTAGLTHFSKYALLDLLTSKAVVKTTQKPLKDVDVLFLVDNSNSMEQEQKNLTDNFPKLIARLEKEQMNYRVGVVSSDLGAGKYSLPSCETEGGDGGKLVNQPPVRTSCPTLTQPWVEKIGGKTNVPGDDVAAAFSCIAQLGTGGCGFEHQLEAVYRALDPALNVNPGFLRPDAALAVVYITDEDDCSAADPTLFDPAQQGLNDPLGPLTSFRCFDFGITCDVNDRSKPGPRKDCVPGGKHLQPVSRYVDQLKKLKPQVLVSAVTGPAEPVQVGVNGQNPELKASCQSPLGTAVPAIRLKSFIDAFGKQGSWNSICDGDFSSALESLAQAVVNETSLSWCLPYRVVDTNPLTKETDGDCLVVGSKKGPISACSPSSTGPCYGFVDSPACATSQLLLQVRNLSAADLGDELFAVCLTPDLSWSAEPPVGP